MTASPPDSPAERSVADSSPSLEAALRRDLDLLRRAGLYRELRRVEGREGVVLHLAGRQVVDFASNDYLGLATDSRVAEALERAPGRAPVGAGASPSIAGYHALHAELETALAEHKRAEAALLFTSGYAANLGAVPALADKQDVVYSDALNHASIIDGCRLSRATVRTFPHADLERLEAMLDEDRGRFRRRLVVVEGVYSMDGDTFPLDRLVPLARAHGAWLYVDDAHGTGVLGARGAGTADALGVLGEIDVSVGTLGKALGVAGAFVAGPAALRELLVNRARSFIYTTASPPALAAAALAALRISREEEWRRERLRARADELRRGLERLGVTPPARIAGHIVPVIVGESGRAVAVGRALLDRGFLVGAVRPPTVPLGTARLRITLSAAHEPRQIAALLEALADLLPSTS
jgi:8-amino-7-oxononanoate synthase